MLQIVGRKHWGPGGCTLQASEAEQVELVEKKFLQIGEGQNRRMLRKQANDKKKEKLKQSNGWNGDTTN